jgi:hypothetical protein
MPIGENQARSCRQRRSVGKITFGEKSFRYRVHDDGAVVAPELLRQDHIMTTRFVGCWALASRANLALALTLFTAGSALATPGTPAQKKACTPDVYRLCAGEIPNVRAITACLRRQKASLSEGCRAVFEQ